MKAMEGKENISVQAKMKMMMITKKKIKIKMIENIKIQKER